MYLSLKVYSLPQWIIMLSSTGLASDTSWVYHHASDASSSQNSINTCLVNEWPFKSHLKEGDREKEVIIAYKVVPLSGEQHCFRTFCVKALIKCCDILISFSGWRYSAKLDFCLDFLEDFLPWQDFFFLNFVFIFFFPVWFFFLFIFLFFYIVVDFVIH